MASGQLELSLFGQKIRVKHGVPDSDDPELVAKIAKLVQKKVKDAENRAPAGSAPHHVALVALLDLAAEYLQAKKRTADYQREVDRKSSELIAWVEQTLEPDTAGTGDTSAKRTSREGIRK